VSVSRQDLIQFTSQTKISSPDFSERQKFCLQAQLKLFSSTYFWYVLRLIHLVIIVYEYIKNPKLHYINTLKEKFWIFLTYFRCILMLKHFTATQIQVFWDLTLSDWVGVTC